MNPELLEQARFLHDTIRLMKRKFPQPQTLIRDRFGDGEPGFPDLTIPQLNLLMACHDLGATTIKEIAAELDVSPPSVSAMVDRLIEIGAVTREQSSRDRRQVVVKLTAFGKQTVLRMEEFMIGALAEVLEKVGPEYAEKWCDVYREINRVFQERGPADSAAREGVAL
jgi:DNA-binding MarR family transcriptional regulator